MLAAFTVAVTQPQLEFGGRSGPNACATRSRNIGGRHGGDDGALRAFLGWPAPMRRWVLATSRATSRRNRSVSDAITVALLGRNRPPGTFGAGLRFFGAFKAGGYLSTRVCPSTILILQSVIVLRPPTGLHS